MFYVLATCNWQLCPCAYETSKHQGAIVYYIYNTYILIRRYNMHSEFRLRSELHSVRTIFARFLPTTYIALTSPPHTCASLLLLLLRHMHRQPGQGQYQGLLLLLSRKHWSTERALHECLNNEYIMHTGNQHYTRREQSNAQNMRGSFARARACA